MKLSEVLVENDLFRIEAEYFSKAYLQLEKYSSKWSCLSNAATKITCGPFGPNLLDSEYKDKGVLVVRPFNLKNGKVENDNLVYISEEYLKSNILE